MNDISVWIFRCENKLFTQIDKTGGHTLPRGHPSDFDNPKDALFVGEYQGLSCYTADLDKLPENIAGELMPARSLFNLMPSEIVFLAGRAIQLLDWQKNHHYCGKCGATNILKTGEFAMFCSTCELTVYPRISPAIMVLISREDEILLARGAHFKPGVFSALAGFVEAGETLEQCAIREVREEVGIEITNLRYFKSQSWPFPNSLMVAFFADYAGGDIKPDPVEIEAAAWFSLSTLPALPDPVSISRQLIEAASRNFFQISKNK
jgi:NAD+ diphosphatase